MQPLNDDELRGALRQWRAPGTPPGLEQKILASAKGFTAKDFWQWLATGSVRVPVPLGIGLVVLLFALAFQATRDRKPPEGRLSEFQAVKEFKPRIIRSSS
ncbi:MAG TPA: hypothetical protein VK604_06085, partial [Bryobacteraceae bacterium]|nr:hypothetical protein [Bryobacteraceae bacterium]